MRFVPKLPVGIGDQLFVKLFTDILANLTSVLDLNTYKLEIVWNPPLELAVPTAGNRVRLTQPDIVRCARAFVANDTSPVHFGATQWTWIGNGRVRIDDVDGLAVGTKYNLVFEAIG